MIVFCCCTILVLLVVLIFAKFAIEDAKRLLEDKDVELKNRGAVLSHLRVELDIAKCQLDEWRNTSTQMSEMLTAESKRIHDVMAYLKDSGYRS